MRAFDPTLRVLRREAELTPVAIAAGRILADRVRMQAPSHTHTHTHTTALAVVLGEPPSHQDGLRGYTNGASTARQHRRVTSACLPGGLQPPHHRHGGPHGARGRGRVRPGLAQGGSSHPGVHAAAVLTDGHRHRAGVREHLRESSVRRLHHTSGGGCVGILCARAAPLIAFAAA